MNDLRALFKCVGVFLGVFFLTGMGGRPDGGAGARRGEDSPPAYVTKVSIQDTEILRGKKAAVVTFSAPMVDAGAVNKKAETADSPFIIIPAVGGEGYWVTDSSFAFIPDNDFRRGTQYFLHLKDDLKTLDGKPARYLIHFRTKGVVLSSLEAENFDKSKQTLSLALNFDQVIQAKALEEHLVIKDKDSGDILPYTVRGGSEPSSRQKLTVSLGKYRPKLEVLLRADADADKHYLGLSREYTHSVSLPVPEETRADPVTQQTDAPSDIKITHQRSGCSDGELYAYFDLSENVRSDNYKDFIKVEPEGLTYTFEYGDRLRFAEGLKPGMQLSVTLKPGLVDEAGRILAEERGASVIITDYEPAARFAHRGNYLSPVYGSRLGVDVVNADKVAVVLRRQYDNNLPFMTLEPRYWVKDLMRDVGIKEVTLEGGKKNEIQRRSLNVADLVKGRRGVFMVRLDAYKEKTPDSGGSYLELANHDEQVVVLTDIGVTARVFPSGITVFAAALSTAAPLAGADVRVYSESNQLVAQGKTGPDGLYVHRLGQRWDPQLRPAVVTVQYGSGDDADLTFLPLDGSTQKEMADTALRDYLDDGNYEAFAYTPRGVFRPGERVDVKAFVRNSSHLPPEPFPVLFRVTSSRDLEAARGSAVLSREGGADFFFTLPATAPTGEYHAYVEVPGQKGGGPLGYCVFSVEDFVPPRLEVGLTPEADSLSAKEKLSVDVSGRYLFGTPGADLQYEFGYRVTAKAFTPKGWDGYVFGDGERKFDARMDLRHMLGKLDGDGRAKAVFSAPADWLPPALLNLFLVASVQEDGGRWVSRTSQLTYFPTPYLLGLKQEGGDAQPGKPVAMKVAAVDPAGKPVAGGVLKAEIFLVKGAWYTVYRNNRYVSLWEERLIAQDAFAPEAKNGEASFLFTPRQYGRYLVRVSTADGAIVASRRIRAMDGEMSAFEDGSGRLESVELSFDKADYRVGDTARLSVKAPYAGTLLLGIERGPQLSSRVVAMPQPATVVEIPVTADMDPNAAITAWVIRPVREENKEWYAHRAYGMIPLTLSKTPHKLKLSAETPDRALPDSPLSISFTVSDEQGRPVEGEFSAAFIDEGILSLTAFATPDPVEFFMADRRTTGHSFDIYDALLRPEAKATPLLLPGGDAAQYYQGSLSTQQVFLTAYQPAVRTDADGRGEVRFDVPEYSGKGRLMIVGASGNLFASSATEIRVARDLVIEASAPRAVAPGDTFEISCNVFSTAAENGGTLSGLAGIDIAAEGPIRLSGELQKSLPLTVSSDSGKETTSSVSHRLAVMGEALQESGIGAVIVKVSVPGRDDLSFSKRIEVAVRPPYPRTGTVTTALLRAGETATMAVPGEWLKGSVKASFSMDRSPALTILPALEYLREYPYGCLEQITSRAWPYLVLPSVQELLYPDADKNAAANNSRAMLTDIVARIVSMQTGEGGFGLWAGRYAPDPWKSVNAAFFLVEAKAGVPVSKNAMDNALGYLRLLLAAKPRTDETMTAYDYSTRAYAAFVLTRAGDPPVSWIQHLSKHEEVMLPSGRIFLAGAKALKAGNSGALKALEAKEKSAFAFKALQEVPNDSMEGDLRNTSLRLLLWSLVAPNEPEAAQLCAKVVAKLADKKRFTTQEAGMAALAVGRYLENTGASAKSYTAKIEAEGSPLAAVSDGGRLVLSDRRLPLSADGQPPALSVAMGDGGPAYGVYSVRGVPRNMPEPIFSGLSVGRIWKDAQGKELNLSSGAVRVKKGDRILVELWLRPDEPVSHIALSDLLPGGMEVENPRLKTAAGALSDDERRENGGEDSEDSGEGAPQDGGMFLDLREDRLLVFFDRVEGHVVYRYSMRAVSRGSFVLPPLAADGMYDPDIRAVDSAGIVIVE
ncbi:MAG: hypothetical protein LBD42_03915 [Desulfovibrio sp.]|nr:hypothetical protein [Desulfovibrio sp.]